MLKCAHSVLLFLSGLVWLVVGCNLLPLGLRLLLGTLDPSAQSWTPLLDSLAHLIQQPEQAVQLIVLAGLLLGFLKGRTVMAKAVAREVARIRALPNPAPITCLYGIKAVIVLAIMGLLGMSMKWFQVPPDVRGGIDIAIGAALINGAVIYFKQGLLARQTRLGN